MQVGLHHSWSG